MKKIGILRIEFKLFAVFLIFNFHCFSQTIGDKKFYLVDSLVISELTQEDKFLVDSCLQAFHAIGGDTNKINTINHIVENCWDDNVWPKYNEWVLNFIESKPLTANAELNRYYEVKKADAINNKGYFSYHMGDIPASLKYYHKSLKIREKLDHPDGISNSCNNIAMVYESQGDMQQALEYYNRSLEIRRQINNKKGLLNTLNNIGAVYYAMDSLEKALVYWEECLEIQKIVQDKRSEGMLLNNMAVAYKKQGNLEKSLSLHLQSAEIRKELNDLHNLSIVYNNIANVLYEQKKISGKNGALYYALEAYRLAEKIDYPNEMHNAALCVSRVYQAMGKGMEALEYYKIHIKLRDQLLNEENAKAAIESEIQYEYEKKILADSVANANAKLITDAEIARRDAEIKAKKNLQYGLVGGITLILVFLVILFQRLTVTQKQKKIIEEKEKETQAKSEIITRQKELVEEKQKEILDSINYAKRIQNAILPPQRIVTEMLPNNFIFYKPKDIVAGDFYWFHEKDGNILFAAADCTGHGVPGAMVSVVCNNGLNRSVREYGLTDPGKILDKTRELVVQEFEKSDDDVKDGMDISLCALSFEKMTLTWAGANNPLWIIRNNQLLEFKPNKQAIGKVDNPLDFLSHTIQLQKDDSIYIFTDGLQDQFGGERGKKFKAAKLKEILLFIQHQSMPQQKEEIFSAFNSWKGTLEQVDDVCVVGVRV